MVRHMLSGLLEKVGNAFKSVLGTSNERLLREMYPLVDRINSLEPEFQRKTDSELRELTGKFRERLRGLDSYEEKQRVLDEILPRAFANVREVARRALVTPAPDSPYPTMRPFDVQLVGGIALHRGMIAEMVTGEGKTLVATFAAYLNALAGDGVHIVTVNDYLARRDCEWMSPVYNMLGLTAGAIQTGQGPAEKRAAYECDITYGTNSEFGFDYLRDNMRYSPETQVQLTTGLNYAIIDEVDSILIDEARTPLIISGPAAQQSEKYYKANSIVRSLEREKDYIVKEKEQACHLTDEGEARVERMLGVDSIRTEETMEWPHFLETALRAHEFYERDTEYIVKEGEVVIVDEFTGRLMEGRVWGDGLHQAVTVKEGLKLREETQTQATITYQNFFRLYNKLAGMTGTAMTEGAEFHKIYGLTVVAIPTNLPLIRKEHPDVVYGTRKEKWRAVVDEIEDEHEEGRPVLVGTTSIEKSETVSTMLARRGIEHEVLNARPEHAAREAEIVAKAGQAGNVTLATNMAGRGVDIVLGPGVPSMGGLHIVGTERHEARRVDNQLRGRAGRQGDPGSSRFFVSFEDDLMRIFAPESMRSWLQKVGMEDGMAIESKMVTRWIEKAQKRVEDYNFDVRKNVLEYDEVMDEQRKSVYSWRQKFVEGRDVEDELLALVEDAVLDGVDTYVNPKLSPEEWDFGGLEEWFERKFGRPAEIPEDCRGVSGDLEDYLVQRAREIFGEKCERVGREGLLDFGRYLALRTIDMKWKDHLYAMDALKSGIGLRGYAQVDPKLEYKSEGGAMFEQMLMNIADEVTDLLFRVEVEERTGREVSGIWQISEMRHDEFNVDQYARQQEEIADSAGGGGRPAEPIRVEQKVGRNDPCPCGSGKKYKHCCGGVR
ncbi:MAG: preprotein translocase subunit SecA [Candidatus Brocadiaceae bacterium]